LTLKLSIYSTPKTESFTYHENTKRKQVLGNSAENFSIERVMDYYICIYRPLEIHREREEERGRRKFSFPVAHVHVSSQRGDHGGQKVAYKIVCYIHTTPQYI
jgi:hypothetical protein